MKTVLFLTAALCASLAGAALAQQPQPIPGDVFALSPDERFKATDKNGDGKVTKDEFAAILNADARPFVQAIWDNRDANQDGWLSPEEMNANGGGRLGGGRGGGAAAAIAAGRAGRAGGAGAAPD